MSFTLTLPLFHAILAVIVLVSPLIWSIVSMYFTQKETKKILASINEKIKEQDTKINTHKEDVDGKFMSYQKYFDDRLKISENHSDEKFNKINDVLISTKTLVELLVQNKIKN